MPSHIKYSYLVDINYSVLSDPIQPGKLGSVFKFRQFYLTKTNYKSDTKIIGC